MGRTLIFFGFLILGTSAFGALKDTAYGIYSLTKIADLGLEKDKSWINPNITGVIVRTWWANIQPNAPGEYDWSYIDEGVTLAQKYNKKIAITIVAGIHSPGWIYTKGAQKFTIQGVGAMPCPWDSVFQSYWQQFVLAFGARYDSVQVVSYITAGGPGRTEECYLCKTKADVQELNNDGGVQVWIQAAETIAGFYSQAFPTTPFLYADGEPIPGDKTDYGTVVNYCVNIFGSSFGIKSDGLYPHYSMESYGATEIPVLSPTHVVGFQDLRPFKNSQTLQETLDIGIELKGHFIEVSTADVKDAGEQTVIAHEQSQLVGQ
jgi:hypothetical protein